MVSGRLSSSRPTSARPASSTGLATVVSGGWQKSAPKMSSWPTTEIAPGTATPRCSSLRSTPIAIRSLNATSAVAPEASPTSAAATPPSSVGGNGPSRTISAPAAREWAASASHRLFSVHALRGPPR